MFKRILVLTLTAVCLAAALLVLYNFTAEKHASRVANFLYAPPARAHILTDPPPEPQEPPRPTPRNG